MPNPIPCVEKDVFFKIFFSQGEWCGNFAGEMEIGIDMLETTQPLVRRSVVMRKLNDSIGSSAVVVHIEGRYVLQDGNHSVAAAILRGDKTIKVKLYEYK